MFASKWSLFAMIAVSALPLSAAEKKPAPGIGWRNDLPAALASSVSDRKPVLLRFTAKWCAPCRVMDARIWTDPAVVKAVDDRLIPVAIDLNSSGAGELARKYRVHAVPTILIFDTEGGEISRAAFMGADQTLKFVTSFPPTE